LERVSLHSSIHSLVLSCHSVTAFTRLCHSLSSLSLFRMSFEFSSQHAISPRTHPYEHSLASSASSSSSSIFSNDAASQTSSTSSSSCIAAAWEANEGVWRSQACPESFRANGDAPPVTVERVLPPLPSIETSLPARQRHHHLRRCSVSRPRLAPFRQSERKKQFVDGLVGEFKFFSSPPLALAYSVCLETPQPRWLR